MHPIHDVVDKLLGLNMIILEIAINIANVARDPKSYFPIKQFLWAKKSLLKMMRPRVVPGNDLEMNAGETFWLFLSILANNS